MSKLNYRKTKDISEKILHVNAEESMSIAEELYETEITSLNDKEKKLLRLLINEKMNLQKVAFEDRFKSIEDVQNKIFSKLRDIDHKINEICKKTFGNGNGKG